LFVVCILRSVLFAYMLHFSRFQFSKITPQGADTRLDIWIFQ
jgi:hypothetical protein